MAEETGIEWCHATFNPWWGCAKVSPACDHCYAERDAHRYVPGTVFWGTDAARREFGENHWNQPLKWNRKAGVNRERWRVFCASMADVFDKNAPLGARERLWGLIAATPHLDWLLLTKRIGNAARMLPQEWLEVMPPNVWLGSSIVTQAEADRDIPKLLDLPARVRFLSCEPMLEELDLRWAFADAGVIRCPRCRFATNRLDHGPCPNDGATLGNDRGVDWIIAGGESGPGARPMRDTWARSLRDQCAVAGVPFLFKQWGEWLPYTQRRDGQIRDSVHLPAEADSWKVGKHVAGRLLDGVQHDGYPPEVRS